MPRIGNPNDSLSSRFGNIKIRNLANQNTRKGDKNLGDELNRITGKAQGQRFVDRRKHNNLGKDGFLKLLSHQLSNQDPLTPMDQKRFAADLAQFSQLEQLANINTKMEKTEKNFPAQNKFYGASFIGKKVLTRGTTITYREGERPIIPFYLDRGAQKAIIRIYDEAGSMVRQMEVDNLSRGGRTIEWDGKGEDGFNAVKGIYKFDVTAFDEDYNKFSGQTRTEGVVTGVNFDNGETILLVDGSKQVFLRDVKQFQILKPKEGAGNAVGLKKAAGEAYTKIVDKN